MEGLRFTLYRVEQEANEDLDASKLLGLPVMPLGFSDKMGLDEYDYFIAQINCAQVKAKSPFPEKGWLYIFLNAETLQPRVFYTEEEPGELLEEVNDAFDKEAYGDPTCLQMIFTGEDEGGSFVFGEIDPNIGLEGETIINDKLTLLQIDSFSLPQDEQRPFRFGNFGTSDGHWVFLIEEEDLAALDFGNVEFVETEY